LRSLFARATDFLIRRSCALIPGQTHQHWARIVMDRTTLDYIRSLPTNEYDVLEISGNSWRDRSPFRSYTSVEYPDFNICSMTLSRKFDLIIAEQVFEHLLWPYRAGKNVWNMLRNGGQFLITVPFLLKVHDAPVDCSRWTEIGLKCFLAECGFPLELIKTGSWGNRKCVKANLITWREYNSRLHSLRNDEYFPVSVWAWAKKPE